MSIVNTTRAVTSKSVSETIQRLLEAYPSFRSETLSTTAFQRPIQTLVMGRGPKKVLYTAAHHANEWITALILLKFAEDYGNALKNRTPLLGTDIEKLDRAVTFYMVPLVNPDGVDLVNGAV